MFQRGELKLVIKKKNVWADHENMWGKGGDAGKTVFAGTLSVDADWGKVSVEVTYKPR